MPQYIVPSINTEIIDDTVLKAKMKYVNHSFQFPANLVTFTEEILNGKLHFLCSVMQGLQLSEIEFLITDFFFNNATKSAIRQKLIITFEYTLFYITNTLISNTRLKLTKNQANAKQHPESEPLLFENCSCYSFKLSSKNNTTYSIRHILTK